MLTQERLKEVLRYEPETGLFYWKVSTSRNVRVGAVAGYFDKRSGYIRIGIDKKYYGAHRLAWLYVYGEWPDGDIDHKFGDRKDNRIDHLRIVSRRLNNENQRTSHKDSRVGLLGVSHHRKKFRAMIQVDGVHKYLGVFVTPEEAHAAYLEAKRKYHEGNTL